MHAFCSFYLRCASIHFWLLVAILCSVPTASWAQRPAAYKLLPAKTLAYVRIADIHEMIERFDQTSMGRIVQEQQFKSFSKQLFEEAEVAFEPAADRIGLTITELLAIPQGEITFAVVAPPSGLPAPVLMVDIENQQTHVQKLLDTMASGLESQGMTKMTESVQGTELTVFQQDKDPRFTGVIVFEKDSTLVMTSNLDSAKEILAAWNGDVEQEVLEDNEDFADVMRHSKGPRGETPQVRWFIDPISFAKVAFRGNFGAQTAMAVLPVVGVDGLHALGGSVTMASKEYDWFAQNHFLTAEPRRGVLAMLALRDGTSTPEDWVPHDASSYQTTYFDLKTMQSEGGLLYDSFRGEEAFQREILDKASEFLGFDVEEELVEALGGRYTWASWIPTPVSEFGSAGVVGISIAEEADFKKTLDQIMEKFPEAIEERTYAGIQYYVAGNQDESEADDAKQPRMSFTFTSDQLVFGLVDNYLLLTGRPEYLERAILTRSESVKTLKNELDFKLVASKLRRQPGGKSPARFTFNRPEESFRMLYEMALADSTRETLTQASESNPFLDKLNTALNDNPLPPFATLRKYFAPAGSIWSADDKGFHQIMIGLRRTK